MLPFESNDSLSIKEQLLAAEHDFELKSKAAASLKAELVRLVKKIKNLRDDVEDSTSILSTTLSSVELTITDELPTVNIVEQK